MIENFVDITMNGVLFVDGRGVSLI